MIDLVSYIVVMTELDFSPGQRQSSFVNDEVRNATLDPSMTGLTTDEELSVGH